MTDFAFLYNIDLAGDLVEKLAHNGTRGYKHGGKHL